MYLEYLNLPKIPDDLINNVFNTIAAGRKYTSQGRTEAEIYEHFSSIEANKDLKQFTESIFNFPHLTHIFFLTDDLPIHVDNLDVRKEAYNYVIQSGDGCTNIHDTDKNIIESYKIKLHTWHRLDVSQYHSVSVPNPPRILITVTPIKDSK